MLDNKELKQKIVNEYNELQKQRSELATKMLKLVGKLELLEEQEKECQDLEEDQKKD